MQRIAVGKGKKKVGKEVESSRFKERVMKRTRELHSIEAEFLLVRPAGRKKRGGPKKVRAGRDWERGMPCRGAYYP